MAIGFVAKFHSHILHTSKINSVSLTSRRKYKTNSSSPISLKILNKILGKTLQHTLGVDVILKCIKDCPCFTTKPFFTECTGHRHLKLGRNAPYSKIHFYDSAEQFNDSLEINKTDNKSTCTDIESKVQTIDHNKISAKYYEAYFAKCIVQHHQKPNLNALEHMSNPLKDPATDQMNATYFLENNNVALEKSKSKPAFFDIGSKVHTIQYINKVKQAKFQKPYFTKCPGHFRYRPGSRCRFPLYSNPSKNPALDLNKAIYLSNKDNLVVKIYVDKSAYFNNGFKVQTTEYSNGKVKFQKSYFTKSLNTLNSMHHNQLKDPSTDKFKATYFSNKENLAIDKSKIQTKDTDIMTKAQTIEYNKVKLKMQSPYFTKCTGPYQPKPDLNAPDSMYPNSLIDPALDRIEATYIFDKDNIAIREYKNKPEYIDIQTTVQRIEYNKVKPRFRSPYLTNRTGHQNLDRTSEPMFSLHPMPSLTPIPARKKNLPDLDDFTIENLGSKSVDMEARLRRIEYNKVKAKYVESLPSQESDYGFNSVKRRIIVPKLPQPEAELDRSDMIESQPKYNKVKPKSRHSDPKDSKAL